MAQPSKRLPIMPAAHHRSEASVRWFKDQTYNFEILRSLGESTYGGAEIGEVLSAISGVKAGDDEAWYQGWHRVAAMVKQSSYACRPCQLRKSNAACIQLLPNSRVFPASCR